MALEIERKFLVDKEKWKKVVKPAGNLYRQGYLLTDPDKTIRVRLSDSEGYITIKGISNGPVRKEFDYAIPAEDARELLNLFAMSRVTKTRYKIIVENKLWEVDEFMDENDGLVVAEIELKDENEPFAIPDWVTIEVTDDKKYYNSVLSLHPYKNWE